MNEMRICVIIPAYNLIDKLSRCLACLQNTKYSNLWVIIFDNGSIEKIQSPKKLANGVQISILRSQKNLGFAQSNNEAITYALKQDPSIGYFLLLNNDAYIYPTFFKNCLPYLTKQNNLASPYIRLTKNRGIDSMGIDYYSDGTAANRIHQTSIQPLLPAAALFISKNFARNQINIFGWVFIPFFESYSEDVELSLRALLMGETLTVIPFVLASHDRSSTIQNPKSILFLGVRNQLWIMLTTWTWYMIIQNIHSVLHGHLTHWLIYTLKYGPLFMIRVYIHTIKKIPILIKTRRIIQAHLRTNTVRNLFIASHHKSLVEHIMTSRTYKKLTDGTLLDIFR